MIPEVINDQDVNSYQPILDHVTSAAFEYHSMYAGPFPVESLVIGRNHASLTTLICSRNLDSFLQIPGWVEKYWAELESDPEVAIKGASEGEENYRAFLGKAILFREGASLCELLQYYETEGVPQLGYFALFPFSAEVEDEALELGTHLCSGHNWQDVGYTDKVMKVMLRHHVFRHGRWGRWARPSTEGEN